MGDGVQEKNIWILSKKAIVGAHILGLALMVLLLSTSAGAQQNSRTSNSLRQQALQLRSLGDYQGALTKAEQAVALQPVVRNLETVLDLQIRLRQNEAALETIHRIQGKLTGWPEHLAGFSTIISAGSLASAWHHLEQPAKADSVWALMERSAANSAEASAVLSSYRQLHLYERAETYVARQRIRWSRKDLWAHELASTYEDQEKYKQAFMEYGLLIQSGKQKNASTGRRLLKLADKAEGDSTLLATMVQESEVRLKQNRPELAELVLDVLVQQGQIKTAIPLAWALDKDHSGKHPFRLVHNLIQDAAWQEALTLLEELQQTRANKIKKEDLGLARAYCLRGLGQYAEALSEFESLCSTNNSYQRRAHLLAAEILHDPLNQIPQAIGHLEQLLKLNGNDLEARVFLVRLLAAQREWDAAESMRRESLAMANRDKKLKVELEYLGVQNAWWQGQLSLARTRLKELLTRESSHPIFNNAIELMDLLAFSGSDSLAVIGAAEAQRLVWINRATDAIQTLQQASGAAGSGAREWLDWQICQIAFTHLSSDLTLLHMRNYVERNPESIRLDRMAWMRIEVLAQAGTSSPDLLSELEAILEQWPESILQDRVRREIRKLEETL